MLARMRHGPHILLSSVLLGGCGGVDTLGPVGAQLYAENCASCHGRNAEGDGPVATVIAVTVPNLRTLRERYGGSFPRDNVIAYVDGRSLPTAHGDRYMPVWGEVFADEGGSIEALTEYLAQIQY